MRTTRGDLLDALKELVSDFEDFTKVDPVNSEAYRNAQEIIRSEEGNE